jgi:hypothetical protein
LPAHTDAAIRRRGGGVAAVISGYRKNEKAKIHTDSLSRKFPGSFGPRGGVASRCRVDARFA